MDATCAAPLSWLRALLKRQESYFLLDQGPLGLRWWPHLSHQGVGVARCWCAPVVGWCSLREGGGGRG